VAALVRHAGVFGVEDLSILNSSVSLNLLKLSCFDAAKAYLKIDRAPGKIFESSCCVSILFQ
jgi:hypothetical protein